MRYKELELMLMDSLGSCTHLGTEIFWFDTIEGTTKYAKDHASVLKDGALIIAQTQTNGKGRYGRVWHSEEGGIWLSYFLFGEAPNPSFISIAAGLAIHNTMSGYLPTKIKWVNDILVGEKKLAGVLIEGDGHYNVVGIGINTNNKDFSWTVDGRMPKHLLGKKGYEIATSVANEIHTDVDNFDIIASLSASFDYWLGRIRQGRVSEMMHQFRRDCSTVGREVMIYRSNIYQFDGKAEAIDGKGMLIVDGKPLMDQEVYYPMQTIE